MKIQPGSVPDMTWFKIKPICLELVGAGICGKPSYAKNMCLDHYKGVPTMDECATDGIMEFVKLLLAERDAFRDKVLLMQPVVEAAQAAAKGDDHDWHVMETEVSVYNYKCEGGN